MSAMVKSDLVAAQPNVHDGTLISEYDNEALDGACITILGRADVEAKLSIGRRHDRPRVLPGPHPVDRASAAQLRRALDGEVSGE